MPRGMVKLICKAVIRPSKTERGIMIGSVEGTRGSLQHTTNMPSLEIKATERYLLMSLTFVVILEGRPGSCSLL